MKNLRWLATLMCVTILVITGFQAYWLKKNYEREERTLEMKSNMAFRRTIYELQALKLKLDNLQFDSLAGPVKIAAGDRSLRKSFNVRTGPKRDMLEMVSVLQEKLKDSIMADTLIMRPSGGSFEGTAILYKNQPDSLQKKRLAFWKSERIFQILHRVDSLQDSLRVHEIIQSYSGVLQKEKVDVPFSVLRSDTVRQSEEPVFNEVTVGFTKPITYRLELGNTFPYLLQKLTIPILFSIFLVGVTILSFVLLYRNLLKQRRLAAIKNEFISNITHELKTPIATVGVAIEALKNFNALHDPERTREYLDISSNELQRLSLLVDKVLKLSMFENKEIELKHESLNFKEIVDEVVSSMRLQFEKNRATVSVRDEGDLHLKGDRLHLLSVVYNLLDNALKYSNGSPAVKVSLEEKGTDVVMTVADNGIGIAPEYKDKIFEKFFRVPAGNTHNAKGYGLGLSYTAHVVHQHGGRIHLESKPGHGSTFSITLPKQLA